MRVALDWWPWLLCAGVLIALGFERVHVMQHWLTIGAFAGCAVVLVASVCGRARREGAKPPDPTGRSEWT